MQGPSWLGRPAQAARSVLANRSVAAAESAFVLFNVAEIATWIAILILAFEEGGTTATGMVGVLLFVPAGVLAPVISAFGQRTGPRRFVVVGYLAQATAVTLTGVVIVAGFGLPAILAAATLASIAMTTGRPGQNVLLPAIVRTPDELIAGNAVASLAEGVGGAVGGILVAALVPRGGAGSVYLVVGAVLLAATLLASRVQLVEDTARRTDPLRLRSLFADAVRTLTTVLRLAGPRLLLFLTMAMTVVYGALGVLLVTVAVDHLAGGGRDVALLSIALSAGLFAGGGLAIGLVGRRVAASIAGASLALAVGLVALGSARLLVVAVVATALAGGALALLDVATRTLMQRSLDDELMAGVFGVIESLWAFGCAAGAALAPMLVAILGLGAALGVLAGLLPILALAARGALRRLDDAATLLDRQIDLLTSTEIFAPLPRLEIERLSRLLDRVGVTAGTTVIREGEAGDRFYLVDEGTFSIEATGRSLASLGPGDHFGEIALLRDVPRTATVRADTDGVLWALDRDEFLETLTGVPSAARAAGDITDRRLRELDRRA